MRNCQSRNKLANMFTVKMAEAWMDYLVIREIEELENEIRRVPRIFHEREEAFELSDKKFIKLFRLDKHCTSNLIESLEEVMREPTRASALSVDVKVLAALRFYACGGYQSTVGQDTTVAIAQSSISRAIDEVTRAINDHLFNRWVRLDLHPASLATLRQGFDTENNFPGVIGAIDCTHVAIVAPPIENPVYRERDYFNRKQFHSINVQLVCDAYMKILNVNARYPGATHDSFIFTNSNLRRALQEVHRRNNNGSMWLLGDSGYPLEPWLLTPIEGNIVPRSKEENFNIAHRKTRNIIERCNGLLKSRFRCLLKHRTLHYMPEKASQIITACTVLHNMCIAREVPHYEDANIPAEDNGMNVWNGEENVNQQPNRNHFLAEGRRIRNRVVEICF